MKGTVFKISGGVFGGGGLVALMITLANAKEATLKEYVDLKHDSVTQRFNNFEKKQDRMLKILDKLEERFYKLNQREAD